MQLSKIAMRLGATREAGEPPPRLEEMAAKLGLNDFERRVVVLLVGKTISPVVRGLMDQLDASPVQRMDETITVGQLLSIFCHGFREQVAHRVHFYRSGRLVSRGVLRVARTRWHQGASDLTEQRVELDRRVLSTGSSRSRMKLRPLSLLSGACSTGSSGSTPRSTSSSRAPTCTRRRCGSRTSCCPKT